MSTNEYMAELDSNGYAPSIVQKPEDTDHRCYLCHQTNITPNRHEIFHGPYRSKSKEYGLWVTLCLECHMALHERWPTIDKILKREGQMAAAFKYGWTPEDMRARFGKNYFE